MEGVSEGWGSVGVGGVGVSCEASTLPGWRKVWWSGEGGKRPCSCNETEPGME